MPLTEEWRPVSGYEGIYVVSNWGRVRRVGADVLAPYSDPRHHPTVSLSYDGVVRNVNVHTLVLTAFRGVRPKGMESRHLDDDRKNNLLENLVWGTTSENQLDAVRNGRNHNFNREKCKLGHLLIPPNLYPYKDSPEGSYSRGTCKSCSKARGYCKYHKSATFEDEADMYYEMTMAGYGDIDRRKWPTI